MYWWVGLDCTGGCGLNCTGGCGLNCTGGWELDCTGGWGLVPNHLLMPLLMNIEVSHRNHTRDTPTVFAVNQIFENSDAV